MMSRWLAFVVWALASATAVAWLLRMTAAPRPVPANATVIDTSPSVRKDWTRVFGAPPPEPTAAEAVAASPLASRLKLVGLVASKGTSSDGQGLALIAVDGKPARAYRVGAQIDGDLVVQSVQARSVQVGPQGAAPAVTLEIPALAAAATGMLPPPAGLAGPGPRPAGSPPNQVPQTAPEVPDGVPQGSPMPPGQGMPPVMQPMPIPQQVQPQTVNPTS